MKKGNIVFYSFFVFLITACLSGPQHIKDPSVVKKIYLLKNDSEVRFDTNEQKNNLLVRDPESVFQIIDTSSDRQWAVIVRMPAEAGSGRVETVYELYYVPEQKQIKLDYRFGELYGFEQHGRLIYLIFFSNTYKKDDSIPVNQLLR